MGIGEAWASRAIRLRCRLADDETRRRIYDQLAELTIRKAALPYARRGTAGVSAMTLLSQQKEHRDEAVPAVLRVLRSTSDLLAKDQCYSALGHLGGPKAAHVLKEAILAGPPEDFQRREFYQVLFQYIGYCGDEAAPVLLDGAGMLDKDSKSTLFVALGRTGSDSVVPYLLEEARAAHAAPRGRSRSPPPGTPASPRPGSLESPGNRRSRDTSAAWSAEPAHWLW